MCADFRFIEDQMEMFHNVLLNAIINTIATYYRVGGNLNQKKNTNINIPLTFLMPFTLDTFTIFPSVFTRCGTASIVMCNIDL